MSRPAGKVQVPTTSEVSLRAMTADDLPVFFEQQLDPVANQVAVFGAKDPSDQDAFMAKWTRILADETITKRTVVADGRVAGQVLSFTAPWSGLPEVSYWIGRDFWGRGVATRALSLLLDEIALRPMYARAARENPASIRVLEKCGFTITGRDRSFSDSCGKEVDEVLLELKSLKAP
jgi:RimJ/RimL family protein N-acetyltransferase